MFCLALEAREINWKCQGLVITRGFKMSLNNVHIVQCGLVWLLLLLDSTDPLQSAFLYFLLAPISQSTTTPNPRLCWTGLQPASAAPCVSSTAHCSTQSRYMCVFCLATGLSDPWAAAVARARPKHQLLLDWTGVVD